MSHVLWYKAKNHPKIPKIDDGIRNTIIPEQYERHVLKPSVIYFQGMVQQLFPQILR